MEWLTYSRNEGFNIVETQNEQEPDSFSYITLDDIGEIDKKIISRIRELIKDEPMKHELNALNGCPFCGGDLEEVEQKTTPEMDTIFIDKCQDCGKTIQITKKYFYSEVE